MAIARCAAGLLDQHAHRVGFIEQAQARATALAVIGRVEENPAALDDAVHVGHHRGGPAHVVIHAQGAFAALNALFDIARHVRRPLAAARHVDGEFAVAARHLHRPVGHPPRTDLAVQCEFIDAGAHGQHQQRLRAIDGIAGRHLAGAGLQEIGLGHVAPGAGLGRAQHRKDRADRQVHVDVARPVDGIEHQQVFALGETARNGMERFHFFRRHRGQLPAPFVGIEQQVVGDHVQLLLHFALDVFTAQRTQHIAQRAL